MPKEEIGLSLLGIGTAFGIWSSTNTSPVGTAAFSLTNPEIAKQGMVVGLAVILAVGGGIYMIYGKKGIVPAIVTGLTGVGLFLWYRYLMETELQEEGLAHFDELPVLKESNNNKSH